MPVHTLLAGIADVQDEDPLLAPALQLAEAVDATLHLVYAFSLPEPILSPYAELEILRPEVLAQHEQGLTARLEAQLHRHAAKERMVCHVLPGPADRAITRMARQVGAELLVVGATRKGTLARTILGTTAQRVLRTLQVPTLVLRQPLSGAPERVLLTTDLSALSEHVHRRGMELVEDFGGGTATELRSLLVIRYDVSLPPPLRSDMMHEVAMSELNHFLGRVADGREGENDGDQ